MAKSKRSNILLTCAGGSATVYFAKALRKKHNLILADASDALVPHWLGLPFVRLPFGNDPSYAKSLVRIVKKYHIDVIVPGADEELLPVRSLSDASHGKVFALIPTAKFISTCLDKYLLMQELDRAGLSKLLPFPRLQDVRYPAIAKPRIGRGSREVHIVKSAAELKGYLALYGKRFSDLVVQPYVKGQEYTTSVIVNDRNQMIGIVPKKVLVKRGITQRAVAEHEVNIEAVCRKIVERFNPCGPFNVQSVQIGKRTFIFEINPRLSTTAVLTDKAFANEIEASMRFRGAEKVRSPYRLDPGWHLSRYQENLFFKKPSR